VRIKLDATLKYITENAVVELQSIFRLGMHFVDDLAFVSHPLAAHNVLV
jgi:hypothetical protein